MHSVYRFITFSLGVCVVLNASAMAQPIEYSAGHGDIAVEIHNGELEVAWHFENEDNDTVLDGVTQIGQPGVEFEADELYVRVPSSSFFNNPGTAPFSFLGNGSGEPVWVLPETQASGVPYLGLGVVEDDAPGDWVGGVLDITIESVNGPGEFSMWVPGQAPFAASSDGLADTFSAAAGGHSHLNWGFTEEGVYVVGISASGTPVGGSLIETETTYFQFVVGDNTAAVPEPGSLALVGLGLGGLALVWRRSKR